MINFIKNSFREFCSKYPALAVLGIILLILVCSQWYYRQALTDPFMEPIVTGTQEGWSVDSMYKARMEIYKKIVPKSEHNK